MVGSHSAPAVVVATKLRPPRPRAAAPPRERLFEPWRGSAGRVLCVVAPAGFGKSTHLVHWATRLDRPLAWVSLDERDNEPVRFWAHVVAALEPIAPAFAAEAGAALTGPRPPDAESLALELINALDRAGPVTLVFDDYHVIGHPEVHAGVALLLDHLPAEVSLAIGSRVQPPLPLARLRGQGEVVDIDAEALRATAVEARAFMTDGMGLALTDRDVERLRERTEGWFVGLQLAALALRGREHDAAALDAFGAGHRLVLAYLTEEVLSGLDPPTTDFLLGTSLLGQLTAEACDALLGRADGARMLRQIEAAGLFLVAIDDGGEAFRYHALFAELLRREALARDRGRVRGLHGRAASWFEAQGDVEEALRHRLAGAELGDEAAMDRACVVVEASALAALQDGRVADLARWLAMLPAADVASRPRLALAQAWVDLVAGDPRSIPAQLDRVDVQLGAPDADIELVGEAVALRTHVEAIRGATDVAIGIAETALPRLAGASGWTRGSVLLGLGAARHRSGELAAAGDAFALAAAAFDAERERHGRWNALQGLGDTRRLQGDLAGAERAYVAMLPPDGEATPQAPVGGLARIGLGKVALERFDLEVARGHVMTGLEAGGAFQRGIWIDGYLTRAVIERCRGDPSAAAVTLAAAAEFAARFRFARAVERVATFQAALSVAVGDLAPARAWREAIGDRYGGQPRFEDHQEHATLVRLALAEGELAEARARLAACLPALAARGLLGQWLELAALEARVELADGRRRAAERVLTAALDAARPAGYVRPFLQDGDALVAMLEALAGRGVAPHARTVLERRSLHHADPSSRAILPPGSEPLTDREHDVYRLLLDGASNKAIARTLDLSVNTIKTHVRTIYGKLGVRSRAQLVARGRDARPAG
jgi:LuxR family transcriptional regulator, maltose regulon positive regulatory protein